MGSTISLGAASPIPPASAAPLPRPSSASPSHYSSFARSLSLSAPPLSPPVPLHTRRALPSIPRVCAFCCHHSCHFLCMHEATSKAEKGERSLRARAHVRAVLCAG